MARKSATSKTGSTASTPPKDVEAAIIDAAMALAAERPWSDLALADIAAAAGIGLIDLYRLFRSKTAILVAFARRLDAATVALPPEPDAPKRDRLFELLMHRFDLLSPYKPGLKGLARDARRGHLDGLALACHLPRALAWTLEAAGVPASGFKGRVRIKILALAYLAAVRAWLTDDSPDLAKTMAALDKSLKRVEPLLRLTIPSAPASSGEVPA